MSMKKIGELFMPNYKIKRIKKRDGRIVPFNAEKIYNAILKAVNAVQAKREIALIITKKVLLELEAKYLMPDVEQIQNTVEDVLENIEPRVFKAFSLYRRSRHHARELKKFFNIKDDLKLSVNAIKVLEERYLLKDIAGKIIETPTEMFRRVAKAVASADLKYKSKRKVKQLEEEFFNALKNLEFLPNSPTLMNAGTNLGQLSACFVLPVEDSLESIFTTLKNMAIIQQSGGGTGFSFSRLRPKGDIVKSTKGVASGPVSFMKIYDATTDVIKQGGKRRGANMGILRVDHPDILEFIKVKRDLKSISNFNISVGVTDKFMNAVIKNKKYSLKNPRNKKIIAKLSAKYIFDEICKSAHISGDPGLIFIDTINKTHPTPHVGEIESTNPCGEQPLLPYESCNLGSINLGKFVKNREVDFKGLEKIIKTSVRFLDNVIDANKYPVGEIEKMTKGNRKIGLGVMGFADMLVKLRIPYDSEKALEIAEKIMKFIDEKAKEASVEIAKERGIFPNFKESIYDSESKNFKGKNLKLRNATLTTIAPTGSISIIADASSGIEPLFALVFVRNVLEGKKLLEINYLFQIELIKRGLFSENLIKKIAQGYSIKNSKLPADMKKIFVTAFDVSPEQHVKMQAIFQKYTDNAVSKTINLPQNSTVEDIKRIYMLAWKLKCKGITVYRYGSKPNQVLIIGRKGKFTEAELSYSGGSCAAGTCSI